MEPRTLTSELSVSPQISAADIADLKARGFRTIVCNRPDSEGADQPNFQEIAQAAEAAGLQAVYQPVITGQVSAEQARQFDALNADLPKPVLAYCRTGTRSATLWALSQAGKRALSDIQERTANAGYDLSAVLQRIASGAGMAGVAVKGGFSDSARTAAAGGAAIEVVEGEHTVVIVGAGAAGIAVAASLRARAPEIDIAIIDPSDVHYYQPGWTLVGAGVFQPAATSRPMAALIPRGVRRIKAAVVAFEPDRNAVVLEGGKLVRYQRLVVCPGLKVDWHAIEGLPETLGKNGVTSNYRFDLAPYTWELVRNLRGGKALFTQPPMPIKCAGAPQKVMYLSCDTWRRQGTLKDTQVQFFNAGGVLFGVKEYVPALMEYVKIYGIDLRFSHNLQSIDGPNRRATFVKTLPDGTKERVEAGFDMIHVVPPQVAPDFIKASPLADTVGWVDVDAATLRHKKYENIFGLGDATNTSNAKTAAATRKQAPVVAHNLVTSLGIGAGQAEYDGYGSCPLTVERGKIVLAEFLYGGKVAPSFPQWLIDGTRPSRLAWYLKERILPPLYWEGMLKGHEWLARPKVKA